MAIQSSDYLAVYQIASGEVRKATVGALLAQGGAGILWKEDGNAVTPKATGADLKIEGFVQVGNNATILADGTANFIQLNSTNINSSGNIRGNASVNAGNGDNEITLDGSNGEITGGANAFIDGGTYN